jgi:hypothetical protein
VQRDAIAIRQIVGQDADAAPATLYCVAAPVTVRIVPAGQGGTDDA